jgi:hypothetical protein
MHSHASKTDPSVKQCACEGRIAPAARRAFRRFFGLQLVAPQEISSKMYSQDSKTGPSATLKLHASEGRIAPSACSYCAWLQLVVPNIT